MFFSTIDKNNKHAASGPSGISAKASGDRVLVRITAFFMVVILAVGAALPAEAARKNSSGDNPKYASIVVDADTGTILSQRYADKSLHPASLTKVMTLMLLFDAMEAGRVRPNDKIMISNRAAAAPPSKIGLPAGSSIRVEDAILSMVTKSANDISLAVAEFLGGSEERFAERMTQRARSIGMSRTTYRNAHGLHDPRQVTTARDQAILARYVLARYPNYYRYFSTKQFTYRGKTYNNHNRLMSSYSGMDGFKTGFINASGFNLIASAKRGDRRLIGVVFGGRSWKTRNDHMASILDGGFSKNRSSIQNAKASIPAVAPPVERAMPTPPAAKPAAPMQQTAQGFTSLDSLSNNGKTITVQAPAPDITGEAIANVQKAINAGDYSEVTGQGDYDAATTRRIETGLLAAAVYKGEARQHRVVTNAATQASNVMDPPRDLSQQLQQKASVAPMKVMTPADLWSIQIGAYNSRVAADDALRRAAGKLPGELSHATPVVVPLQSGNGGILFRGRLGNLTKAQANDACRYFRDCLPLAPQ